MADDLTVGTSVGTGGTGSGSPSPSPSISGGVGGSGQGQGGPSPQSGAQGGSPSSGQGTGTGVSGSGQGSGAPSQGQGQGQPANIDWNTAPAHFRTAYEQAQAQLKAFQELGVEPAVARTYVNTVRTHVAQAHQFGKALGYTAEDIADSLQRNFAGTVAYLSGKAREAGLVSSGQGGERGQGQGGQGQGRDGQGTGQPNQIDQAIAQRLDPIQKYIDVQMTDAANTAFRSEFDRVAADVTAGYGEAWREMPQDFRELVYDALSEVYKYDTEAMHALKFNKDTRGVAKAFNEVRTRIDKAFNAYHQHQLKKAGMTGGAGSGQGSGTGQGAGNGAGSVEGLNLDDLIFDTPKAAKAFPKIYG